MKRIVMVAGAVLGFMAPFSVQAAKPLDFAFTAVDGTDVDLAKMRGKVVIIFYWATWSKESRDEVKTIQKVREKYKDQGLEVVGVSEDSVKDTLTKYTDEYAMNWPEYFSEQGPNNPAIAGMHLKGLPEVWVVGKDGILHAKNPPDLDAAVARVLALK